MPALLTRPASVSPPSAARTSRAAANTAASSVTSNNSGAKLAPNALQAVGVGLLAHAAEDAKPAIEQQLAVAQPMPVDAPVMTTDRMIDSPFRGRLVRPSSWRPTSKELKQGRRAVVAARTRRRKSGYSP